MLSLENLPCTLMKPDARLKNFRLPVFFISIFFLQCVCVCECVCAFVCFWGPIFVSGADPMLTEAGGGGECKEGLRRKRRQGGRKG